MSTTRIIDVGPDGKVVVDAPEFANRRVEIRPVAKSRTKEEFDAFLDRIAGSCPDFPEEPEELPLTDEDILKKLEGL